MKSGRVALLFAAAVAAVPATATPAVPPAKPSGCRAGVLHPVGTAKASYAAVVKSKAPVYRRPSGRVLARFGKLNENGYPTTFGIVGAIVNKECGASWYRVQVPMRPNGTIGYVKPDEVAVQKVAARISIDLSERTLRLYRGAKLVLSTPVAVGSASTPTPTGRFYVNQRILTTDPNGPYGPAALGVSAFSDVLTGWAQGGPIGIHGTNATLSIGQAVSNGCIRVPNDTMKRLFAATPGGAPVVIHA